jgi:ATP-dependent Clp protease ATP-binding subunit ClpA
MLKQNLAARHFTTVAIDIVEQMWPRAAARGMSSEVNEKTVALLALWSLLRWERNVGLTALAQMGVELDGLAKEVDQVLSDECGESRRHAGTPKFQVLPSGAKAIMVDFNTPLEGLLTAAEHEAIALRHTYVGSEHLLLAIIQRACPRLRAVLQARGVTFDRVKEIVLLLLSGE